MREDTERTATRRPDASATSHRIDQRLTVPEAASLLGLSVDAVRKRAERGSLKKEKAPDGTVYIVLDTAPRTTGYATDRGTTYGETAAGRDSLVISLEDQITYLRSELETRNEELRRKDHLLAAALERVPQVEATPEASELSVSRSETTKKGEDVPQESTRHRSWLVRFFFGP
jgi:hypothetical protein